MLAGEPADSSEPEHAPNMETPASRADNNAFPIGSALHSLLTSGSRRLRDDAT